MKPLKLKRWQIPTSILTVIVLLGLIFWGAQSAFNSQKSSKENQPQQEILGEKVIQYNGEEGKTVLELLEKDHKVKYDKYDFGVLVTEIDGVKNADDEFWMYYINGELSPVSASDYVTKNQDQIQWQYQKSLGG